MTHEEAWAHVNRQIDAETGGPYVIPPWVTKKEEEEGRENKEEEEEKEESTNRVAAGRHHSPRPPTCSLACRKDSIMTKVPPTASEASTAQIPEDEVRALMEDHGVQTQVTNDKIQALSIWTDKHAGGGIGSEWVDVVCRRDWVRAFLGY